MQKLLIISSVSTALLLGGCNPFPKSWVHRIEVEQGNIVTQDMVDKLRPGMAKRDVLATLGTPLVEDPFHPNEWVYVYSLGKFGKRGEQRTVKIFFVDDKLSRVAGDVRPEGAP